MDAVVDFLIPLGAVIAAWWIGTAAIMRLDRLPRNSLPLSLSVAGVLALAGVALVAFSSDAVTEQGAYAGFIGTLLIWAWV
ncbi:MAG: DUF3623 family protein, partial [Alphaproteobacteria bacterium]|nr:DUF3623 family protein [Alphaproteobacteria bacterium]